jgi:hypothetical protein
MSRKEPSMNKNIISIIVLIIALFFSCKKEKEVTASGYIYQGCPRQPLKGQKIYFYDYRSNGFARKIYYQDLAVTTTDENGFFVLNGKTKGNEWGVGFGSDDLFYKTSATDNISNLDYYIKKSTVLKIVLTVDSAFTSNDTIELNVYDTNNNYIKKGGPFTNGQTIISNSPNWQSEIHYLNNSEIKKHLPNVSYKINNGAWKNPSLSNFSECDTATVNLKID